MIFCIHYFLCVHSIFNAKHQQLTAAIFYPIALALGAEALVSITRVEELLLLEERGDEEAHALAGSVKAVESKPIQNGNSNGLAHKHDQSN